MQTLTLAQRVVKKDDYVPCAEAFVDTRLPNRDGKLNYCIIGPGVAENSKQHINIVEPHGFNVGGVSLPTGKYNSLHAHETAEVFLICRGDWRFFWGHDGSDGEVVLSPGDVITVPVGCFRAFESVGSDDNFMISFLGEDDSGNVIWENAVIEGAAEFRFYLTKDSKLIDTNAGQELPPKDELMQTLSEDQLLQFHRVSPLEMAARVYNVSKMTGHNNVFGDESIDGGEKTFHAIIGENFTDTKQVKSHVLNPHSFALGAIVAPPNNGFNAHQVDAVQVYVVESGNWLITLEHNDDRLVRELGPEDTVSIPANAIRQIKNTGDSDGILHIVTAGNTAAQLTWI
ncbi:cupin domain-containing protein [Alteromonas oceanisediminis]|uniref:cupin domain-containing protein n=1 Tax=Alteromonas oceanisediminis TaxID=2836180 RepID=UPI001BDA46BB|nr:cupin domain-containing protein [Alteromonas oceanisediminis]MBT0585594.1 hypothetical protein [Alteromonas oceanisediminis]